MSEQNNTTIQLASTTGHPLQQIASIHTFRANSTSGTSATPFHMLSEAPSCSRHTLHTLRPYCAACPQALAQTQCYSQQFHYILRQAGSRHLAFLLTSCMPRQTTSYAGKHGTNQSHMASFCYHACTQALAQTYPYTPSREQNRTALKLHNGQIRV